MGGFVEAAHPLWPWVVYGILVLLTVSGMLATSFVLGQRHSDAGTNTPYESGILPTGSARIRFPINFYVLATLFIIFDVESIFIIAWGIAAKPLGWTGLIEIAVFIGVLGIALLYLWRMHAFDCSPRALKKDKP
jgi:NADH-quinone oxidoreductase subunit A